MNPPITLPGAERATIPTDKLVGYTLSPTHPRGRHKARVFASALGITAADWRYLHDQILEAVPNAPVRSTRITPFGVAYEVIVPIDGLNGATLPIVTTWIVEADAPPRLTSTWVDIPRHAATITCEMPRTRHAVLDVVELLADSGRWPAGTIGTVVEADSERALIEISDDRGHALDFIAVPHDALTRPPDHTAERFAS